VASGWWLVAGGWWLVAGGKTMIAIRSYSHPVGQRKSRNNRAEITP